MDKNQSKPSVALLSENGFYVQGVVISNSAVKITKKDGSPLVIVRHELALQPGVAFLEEFLDPRKDLEVKIEGDEVMQFPKLKEFGKILVKCERVEKNKVGDTVLSSWQILNRS